MIRLFTLALILLLAGSPLAHAAEIIDGIVVTVNGDAILKSDVDTELHYEAMVNGKSLLSLNAGDWEASLERLIDQQLLRREMGADFPAPSAAEVQQRIASIRNQIAGGAREQAGGARNQAWPSLLRRYDLSDDDVADRVRTQMQINNFIDQRLRPGIHVPNTEVQSYYREQLVPELKKAGVQQQPPLRQVRAQIEEVLVQQHISSQLNDWVRSLRQQAQIRSAPDPVRSSAGIAGEGWQAQSIPGGNQPADGGQHK